MDKQLLKQVILDNLYGRIEVMPAWKWLLKEGR